MQKEVNYRRHFVSLLFLKEDIVYRNDSASSVTEQFTEIV
jgi:hypothetical protein